MKHNKGFSLLELSVLLLIISLLIGGLFTAQTLIRSSKINQMMSEYDMYVKAIKEFQDKYYAYPGDMSNAESVWGADASCPNTPFNSTPKTATCNGNGDGKIGDSTNAGVVSNSREWWRAWQQLSNAGFVKQQYSGAPVNAADKGAMIGVNVPNSGLDGGGWTLQYFIQNSGNTYLYNDVYGHILTFGAQTPAIDERTWTGVLTSSEALAIDIKMDDGKPGTGNIRAWREAITSGCTTNDSTQITQTYNNGSASSKACALVFLLGF